MEEVYFDEEMREARPDPVDAYGYNAMGNIMDKQGRIMTYDPTQSKRGQVLQCNI